MAATGPLTKAHRLGALSSFSQVICHRRRYCAGMVLGEEQLVRGAPVLQNYRQKRVAAVTFPKTKDYVNASELVAARRVGSLRANASHLFGAEAQALVPPDRS